MMKTLVLAGVLWMVCVGALAQDFDFAPVGARWNFYTAFWGFGSIGDVYTSTKDTIVSGRLCREVVNDQFPALSMYFYIEPETERVYQYAAEIDSFLLYMDFSLQPGDTLKKQVYYREPCAVYTLNMEIDTVITAFIFGKTHKFVFGMEKEIYLGNCSSAYHWDMSIIPGCPADNLQQYGMEYQPFYCTLYGYFGGLYFYTQLSETSSFLYQYSYGDSLWTTKCEIPDSRTGRRKSISAIAYNPGHKQLSLTLTDNVRIKGAELMDYSGKVLRTTKIYTHTVHISCDGLAVGLYCLRLSNGETHKIHIY
ncbi:MAG: hypothetical protein KF690_06065 [Bacteroidetes bacterium]|nr:hypothetical protein [Bacteroidota bacterium]